MRKFFLANLLIVSLFLPQEGVAHQTNDRKALASDYEVSGPVTVYDFSTETDAEAFDVYPFPSRAGVKIADGVLRIANDQQYKVIFPSEAPLSDEFMVSVDMKGRMSVIDGGLYLFVSSPKDAGDFLNAYDIHVKHNAATETYSVVLYKFNSEAGWKGQLADGGTITSTKQWLTLKAVVKEKTLYVFLDDLTTPVISYQLTEQLCGDVGIRSYFNNSVFDNFTIQSSNYKMKKRPSGYEVEGEPVVYDFSSEDEADYYAIYPRSSQRGVTIADGKLNFDNAHEYKVIFPSETPITNNYMVSIDMKGGSDKIDGGLYLQASDVSDTDAHITSYEVHVTHDAGTDSYVVGLHGFKNKQGYDGTLAWSNPITLKDEWVTLKVVMKDGTFYVFLGDMEIPIISVNRTVAWKGYMGIRSWHANNCMDHFVIQSAEYKRIQVVPTYPDFEFSSAKSLQLMDSENASLSWENKALTATVEKEGAAIISPTLDVAPGDRYSMKLPLRNTFLFRMANETAAERVKLSFRTSDGGEKWYDKFFDVKPNSDFNTYFFNVSDTEATGYMKQFKLTFEDASEGTVKIDAITFEREEPIYDFAGEITSCIADKTKETVEVIGRVDSKYDGKTMTLWQTDMRNWNESLNDKRMVELCKTTIADAQFKATFPLYIKGKKQTQLSNLFLASVDGIKVSPAFKIENYQDFSEQPERFDISYNLTANVLDYGAKGDGFTDDTEAIQRAIDAVKTAGGGRVVVPGSDEWHGRRYVVTHLKMCSNLEFVLSEGAMLWQSQREEELDKTVPVHQRGFDRATYGFSVDLEGLVWCTAYTCVNLPLIYANGCENLRITGGGTIRMNDFGGEEGDPLVFVGDPALAVGSDNRIQQIPICVYECKHVDITDITLCRSNGWHCLLVYDDDVYIGNVTEKHAANVTADGFSPNSCKDVIIDSCMNYTSDDAVLFNTIYNDGRGQFFYPSRPEGDNATANITVRHSFLFGGFGSVFIPWGTEATNAYHQEIRNIHIYDCSLGGHKSSGSWPDDPFYGWSALYDYTQGEDHNYVAIKDIRYHDNTYLAPFEWTIHNIRPWATNMLVTDDVEGTIQSSSVFLNGDFDKQAHNGKGYKDERTWVTGLCYWSDECADGGSVGVEKVGTKQAVTVDTNETFTQDDYAGYAQGDASLFEGLWLPMGDYRFSAKVKSTGGTTNLYVKNLVNGQILLRKKIENGNDFQSETVDFTVPANGTFALGIEHKGTTAERAYIDDASVEEIIDEHKYDVGGDVVVYTFEEDEQEFQAYGKDLNGVVRNEGKLKVAADGEYKVIFPSETPLKEMKVSVDIMVGEMASCNSGIYLFAWNPGNNQDQIDALNVHLEKSGNAYVPKLFKFSVSRGYEGALASGENITTSKGKVTLKVVVKEKMLYVFIDDAKKPCISYALSSVMTGNVGLRSQYAPSVFDNFTIQSPQYKKKGTVGLRSLFHEEDGRPFPMYNLMGQKVSSEEKTHGVYVTKDKKIMMVGR